MLTRTFQHLKVYLTSCALLLVLSVPGTLRSVAADSTPGRLTSSPTAAPAEMTPVLSARTLTRAARAETMAALSVNRRTENDGQLVLENIPAMPADLAQTLDRYLDLRSTGMLEWSRDNKTLYVRSLQGGVYQVQAVRGAGAEPEPITFFSEPVREVVRQHNGELLAITMDEGGSAFDQIHLLDPESGEDTLLTDGESLNNRMVWDKTGQRLAYRSTRRNGAGNDIWIMNVGDPDSARIVHQAGDGALWKPVSFSRDGQQLLVQQYQGITDSRIHLLDLHGGNMRQLVGIPDAGTSNVAIDFDREDQGVFFVSNLRGRSAEIGWVPLEPAGEIRWVESNIQWDVTGFELSPDGRRGAFVTNENGISRLYRFDPRRMTYRPIDRVPLGVISDLRFSPDSRKLALTVSTPTSPGDVYVIRFSRLGQAALRAKPWTSGDVGGLSKKQLITPTLFRYPAPGLEPDTKFYIPGFMYVPKGEEPHPVVIYIHGGPESQFRPSFNSAVQMWASEMGVAVLAPNVRGSLGYGRTWLSLDDGRRREDAVHDIGALLDWIATMPELDETRVAVFGASYGGYMALASAVHYSDRLVAAVDRAGISNFVTYLENTQDYRKDLRRFEYGDERDPEMRAFLESISPLNNVEKIQIPLLIIQGQNDPVVPVTESEQMVDALRARGQTVWTMTALNEGHSFEKTANRDAYLRATYLFLQRFLKPSPGVEDATRAPSP